MKSRKLYIPQRHACRVAALGCLVFLCRPMAVPAQEASFDGLENNLSTIYRLSNAKTRSISPENPGGEKGKGGMATQGTGAGAARDLGQGWKISPSVVIGAGKIFTIAEISGSGAIQHIWMTPTGNWRLSILRMYWDEEKEPSVEVPVGDFFAMGWGKYERVSSLPIAVNPGSAFNSYWPMPFRHKARITLQNIDDKQMELYYQVDYALAPVPADAAYLHAQFRRVNPLPYKQVYTILDGIRDYQFHIRRLGEESLHERLLSCSIRLRIVGLREGDDSQGLPVSSAAPQLQQRNQNQHPARREPHTLLTL